MAKLLVNAPNGEQQLIEVGQGGGYFDESLVLWDERKDGKLPDDIVVGKMGRQGEDLIELDIQLPVPVVPPEPEKQMTLQELIGLLKEKGII